jgi:hypothetical protein
MTFAYSTALRIIFYLLIPLSLDVSYELPGESGTVPTVFNVPVRRHLPLSAMAQTECCEGWARDKGGALLDHST